MSHIDRTETIKDAFEDPKKGTNDMGSFESHSLPDMIAADKYLAEKDIGKSTGTKKKFLGCMVRKFGVPGTVH